MKTLSPRIATVDTRTARVQPKVPDAFYRSRDWTEARALCLALHNHRCVDCAPTAPRPRILFVDHIIEIKDGGALLEQSNLAPRCGSHHTTKSARVRAERFRGET